MQELNSYMSQFGISLSERQVFQFQTYYELLIEWNERMNLTSITERKDVFRKHFMDSLSVLLAFPNPLPDYFSLIDVGSGAGFPGLPLKIVFPQIALSLLEATKKKCDFLNHICVELNLDTIVLNGRAEDVAQDTTYREQYHAVVSRGLAKMANLCELMLPLCRVDGRVIAQKKGEIKEELFSARKAIDVLGGMEEFIIPVSMPAMDDNRCLVVVRKIKNTPKQFPRRNGLPNKNPIR